MKIEDSPASPASLQTPPQLSGGLYLTGTVIAVRTEEKEWEKERYIQTVASVSDGEQVLFYRHKHEGTGFTPPKLFQAIKVRVNYATTDKGKITVSGDLVP